MTMAEKLQHQGNYISDLGSQLNHLEFYKETPPKSLGLEWVNKNVFPLIEASQASEKDILRTFSDHIASKYRM